MKMLRYGNSRRKKFGFSKRSLVSKKLRTEDARSAFCRRSKLAIPIRFQNTAKWPPLACRKLPGGPGAAFYFNSKEEGSTWRIGKYIFASVPTATTQAGRAMPAEPHSKRKAAVCFKSWGGRLPWEAMEAVIQPSRTGRISTCTPAASAE